MIAINFYKQREMLTMHSTYILYNIVPLGFLILLVYIFIDIFLDYFRKVGKINKKRVILYSFIFYINTLYFSLYTLLHMIKKRKILIFKGDIYDSWTTSCTD